MRTKLRCRIAVVAIGMLPLLNMACAGSSELTCVGIGRRGFLIDVVDTNLRTSLKSNARISVTQLFAPFETTTGNIESQENAMMRAGRFRVAVSAPGYDTVTKELTVIDNGAPCEETITQNVRFELPPTATTP